MSDHPHPKGPFEHVDVPHDPELNPPDSLPELDELIRKLKKKSADIGLLLDSVEARKQAGKHVDFVRLQRARYARTCTNNSIDALQRLAKNKREEIRNMQSNVLSQHFMTSARELLSKELFSEVLEAAKNKLAA